MSGRESKKLNRHRRELGMKDNILTAQYGKEAS
jgi:hypothetical protein